MKCKSNFPTGGTTIIQNMPLVFFFESLNLPRIVIIVCVCIYIYIIYIYIYISSGIPDILMLIYFNNAVYSSGPSKLRVPKNHLS